MAFPLILVGCAVFLVLGGHVICVALGLWAMNITLSLFARPFRTFVRATLVFFSFRIGPFGLSCGSLTFFRLCISCMTVSRFALRCWFPVSMPRLISLIWLDRCNLLRSSI